MGKLMETISSLSGILAQSCVTPPYIYSGKGVTHNCGSILDNIAKGTSCFHYFSHCASLHRHSFSGRIITQSCILIIPCKYYIPYLVILWLCMYSTWHHAVTCCHATMQPYRYNIIPRPSMRNYAYEAIVQSVRILWSINSMPL